MGLERKCQSTTTVQIIANKRATILSLDRTLGLVLFSFATNDGSVGEGGGGLKARFSLKLGRDDPDRVELLVFDDTERLVLRRSRIFKTVCIKQAGQWCLPLAIANRGQGWEPISWTQPPCHVRKQLGLCRHGAGESRCRSSLTFGGVPSSKRGSGSRWD